jgi:hypothetical protein
MIRGATAISFTYCAANIQQHNAELFGRLYAPAI